MISMLAPSSSRGTTLWNESLMASINAVSPPSVKISRLAPFLTFCNGPIECIRETTSKRKHKPAWSCLGERYGTHIRARNIRASRPASALAWQVGCCGVWSSLVVLSGYKVIRVPTNTRRNFIPSIYRKSEWFSRMVLYTADRRNLLG